MFPNDPGGDAAEQFYGGALARIRRFMLAIAAAGVVICLLRFPWQATAGFLIGSAISYINHRWLERMVDALGERITTGHSSERGGLLVLRALLRYVTSRWQPMLYLKFHEQVCSASWAGFAFPLRPWPARSAVEIFVGLRHGV